MRSSPRKLSTETDLYTAAINGLARRAYSVYEMRTYLERRAEDKEVVKGDPRPLETDRIISTTRDTRANSSACTPNCASREPFRIARDLRARGVPDRHIEAALAERSAESNESAPGAGAPGAPHQDRCAARSTSGASLRSTAACSAPDFPRTRFGAN